MFPGQEQHILAGQSRGSVQRHGDAFVRNLGELHAHVFAGTQDMTQLRVFLDADAVGVEYPLHVRPQRFILILLADLLHQSLSLRLPAGVEFQQAVTALVQSLPGGGRQLTGLKDQGLFGIDIRLNDQRQQTVLQCCVHRLGGRIELLERIQTLVIPAV